MKIRAGPKGDVYQRKKYAWILALSEMKVQLPSSGSGSGNSNSSSSSSSSSLIVAAAMWPGVLLLLLLLAVLLHPSRCSQVKVNYREKEKQVLDNILGPGRYDARIRPSGENGTGEYRVSPFIHKHFPISPYISRTVYSVIIRLTQRETVNKKRVDAVCSAGIGMKISTKKENCKEILDMIR
ncbi:glutamate-gated chloride channel isoform X1 [Vespula squamosa]|uniref:Glutamate-gated chloride channel isoform X1 n=1 Tax=Vespula squamosa TaxID=30214 RepID=A0ABD2B7E3_VESSQ